MSSVPEPEGRDRDLLEIGAWVSTSSGPALLWRLQSQPTSSADCTWRCVARCWSWSTTTLSLYPSPRWDTAME
jgi:hypothetical protein